MKTHEDGARVQMQVTTFDLLERTLLKKSDNPDD